MNSKEAKVKKIRGSSNVSYLNRALDEMVDKIALFLRDLAFDK